MKPPVFVDTGYILALVNTAECRELFLPSPCLS